MTTSEPTSQPPEAASGATAAAGSSQPTGREWIERFAHELGIAPPDDVTMDRLLELAGVAARASERLAAPIACWLVGVAGLDVDAALDAARRT